MKEESLLLLSDLQKLINQVVLIDYTIIILGGLEMYPNKYYVEMKIATRLSSAFNLKELQILENARIRHNNYFVNASNRQTKNRKYISQIITKGDIIGFYLETEYPVSNIQRIGNALRMYAIMAVDNGFGVYVANQRLMRAA